MTFQRVLEGEVMDTAEEASDYNAMDHAAVNRIFVDDLLRCPDEQLTGDILDLGTGTALIPIELCRRFEEHGTENYRMMAADMSIKPCVWDCSGERLSVQFKNRAFKPLKSQVLASHWSICRWESVILCSSVSVVGSKLC